MDVSGKTSVHISFTVTEGVVTQCHFFFFFQAEDGIRDVAVTGVQTCALPICEALRKLETEGLVDASRSGLVVRQSSEEVLIEIFYLREALEGMAARLAAENATDRKSVV